MKKIFIVVKAKNIIFEKNRNNLYYYK